jgi:flagellar L-ring protein FlgH
MKRSDYLLSLLISGIFLLAGSRGFAASLWQSGTESLFIDQRAHRVGDVITVLIVESSSTSHTAKTAQDKKWSESTGPFSGFVNKFFPLYSAEAQRSASGDGSQSSSTSLTDQISAQIVALLPNNSFRFKGERMVELYPEKIKLEISGTARIEDISPENVISSGRVTDLQITSTGKGPIHDTHKPGLLSQLFRLIW